MMFPAAPDWRDRWPFTMVERVGRWMMPIVVAAVITVVLTGLTGRSSYVIMSSFGAAESVTIAVQIAAIVVALLLAIRTLLRALAAMGGDQIVLALGAASRAGLFFFFTWELASWELAHQALERANLW